MNAYLAEIIAMERIAELRREADAIRLAADARDGGVGSSARRPARSLWSRSRAVTILRRRAA